ncbi:MAG TPA: alpha/beta fold hydrolase [Verrucomicrobiae bacterium]|nr:alpha/beta fold hydrolase [Verrucomicrobiae bacterium]
MNLHFRALGSGPPLVILHGLLGSLDNWVPVAHKLGHHFQIFLVDLRNHGHSPHAEEFGYDEMAEDLREFLNQQHLAKAHILGHSMGGKVAMRFAQLHPGMLGKLVVVDIAPRKYPSRYSGLMDAMLAVNLSGLQRRDEVDVALSSTIPDTAFRQFLLKNLGRDASGQLFWKPNLKSIRANYDAVRGNFPGDTRCDCPALFIRGEKSNYIQENDLTLIHELFPAAQIETIAGAGHWVHANAPDKVVDVATRFLLAES